MPILLDLFITFAKVGVMTFGGGYAMLPILERELVENKHWTTEEDLADYFAIGQCTPGIIAVNTATFIGQKTAGTLGGIFATLGLVFPSFIIITALGSIISLYDDLPEVKNAFAGIRVCVSVLIFNAVIKLWKKAVVDAETLGIFIALLASQFLTNFSPVFFILASAILGIIIKRRSGEC